jgi:predicted Zn-dependent protease
MMTSSTSSMRRSTPRRLLTAAAHADPSYDHFLSPAVCRQVGDQVLHAVTGGGHTLLTIDSMWTSNIRWARNTVSTSGEVARNEVSVGRVIRDARGYSGGNSIAEPDLQTLVHRAEALAALQPASPEDYPGPSPVVHPIGAPKIWFDTTYSLDAKARGAAAGTVIASADAAGLLSAGYLEVAARGRAVINESGVFRYYPYTTAQYSVTVRDPKGIGSGWAGVDDNDWGRINAARLSDVAMDKCVRSRNPSIVEPGRYTTILEPQAVCDFVHPLILNMLDRIMAEGGTGPFAAGDGNSRIGQKMVDERITIGADPEDPDCGFPPFDWNGEPYRAVNWIEHGVLKELAYPRMYGLVKLNSDWALPNAGGFRMSGGTTTVDQMIANTTRGILVTRFSNVAIIDASSMLQTGMTRDGVWLVEHGKISRPVKNFRFTESSLFALNNVEALGVPQRVFSPGYPVIVPALTVRDFNFTSLLDGV